MSEFQDAVNEVEVGPKDNRVKVVLPRMTLKKIMAVTHAVDKLVKSAQEKSPQFFELFSGRTDTTGIGLEIVKLLPTMLPPILDEVIEVIAIYINKDKEWVSDNMDVEDLVAVATPFFGAIMAQATHVVNPLSNMFQKQETSQPSSQNSSTSLDSATDGK